MVMMASVRRQRWWRWCSQSARRMRLWCWAWLAEVFNLVTVRLGPAAGVHAVTLWMYLLTGLHHGDLVDVLGMCCTALEEAEVVLDRGPSVRDLDESCHEGGGVQ